MAWRRLRWQAGSLFFPVATSRALERLWFTPPRGKPSAEGLRLLDTARTEWALVTGQGGSRRVRVYRWGSKGPIALLAHGWGGNAGQWHAVVKGLLAAGMRVVAFDALSHGASDAGAQGPQQTSALEMARSLLAVAWHVGPVHCVIAHSLGGAAAALAIREGLPVRGVVMIGSPADMHDACSALAWQLGIAPHILSRMQRRSEQWLGATWSSFNVPDVGRTRPVPPALIIHDRTDKRRRHCRRLARGKVDDDEWPGPPTYSSRRSRDRPYRRVCTGSRRTARPAPRSIPAYRANSPLTGKAQGGGIRDAGPTFPPAPLRAVLCERAGQLQLSRPFFCVGGVAWQLIAN
jgi:pimeloyl-ACP methyl ester carboxylesterase